MKISKWIYTKTKPNKVNKIRMYFQMINIMNTRYKEFIKNEFGGRYDILDIPDVTLIDVCKYGSNFIRRYGHNSDIIDDLYDGDSIQIIGRESPRNEYNTNATTVFLSFKGMIAVLDTGMDNIVPNSRIIEFCAVKYAGFSVASHNVLHGIIEIAKEINDYDFIKNILSTTKWSQKELFNILDKENDPEIKMIAMRCYNKADSTDFRL